MILLILIFSGIICSIYMMYEQISTREFIIWLISSILAILIIYLFALLPFNNDTYFQSGRITATIYHPFFVEKYLQSHTYCTPCGKSTCCHTYYTTEYAKHSEYWSTIDTLGRHWEISKNLHNEIKLEYGNKRITTKPNKCTHGGIVYKGDPYLYTYYNETNSYKYPTNKIVSWYNRIKATQNIFNNKTNYKKEYPKSINIYSTNRLLTKGTDITEHDWDILNTKIYERSRANIILTKVNNMDEAKQLENAWLNGRKNDIIISYVGNYKNPEYVKVFGWTKSSLIKHKLESFILKHGIQKSSLKGIEHIIISNYEPYDFSKFNYLSTPPSIGVFITALILTLSIAGGLGFIFMRNYESKDKYDPDFFNL